MSLKGERPSVTDHAVLRYLERVMGVDVEAIRDGLLTPEIKQAIRLGAKSVTVQGVTFKVEGPRIVTVIETRRSSTLCRQVPLRGDVEVGEEEYV